MTEEKKCEKCGGKLELEDNSFDHEFGKYVEKFYYCENCLEQYDYDYFGDFN
jgi:uncharacterized protein with PIN domain